MEKLQPNMPVRIELFSTYYGRIVEITPLDDHLKKVRCSVLFDGVERDVELIEDNSLFPISEEEYFLVKMEL